MTDSIIDCVRTYTFDKKLESLIKASGIAGGGRNKPTITSPKEYKRRFREAMERYIFEAPKYVDSSYKLSNIYCRANSKVAVGDSLESLG